jgi:hypothetical protein
MYCTNGKYGGVITFSNFYSMILPHPVPYKWSQFLRQRILSRGISIHLSFRGGGARFTPLVQRVSLYIDVTTCSMAGKGRVQFVRYGVGNLYSDVASPGEAQINHTVRDKVLFLYSYFSGNLSCVVASVIHVPRPPP